MTEHTPSALSVALGVAAVVAILAVPQWSGEPSVASKKADERIEALEAESSRQASTVRGLEARLIHLEDGQTAAAEALAAVVPQDARWIPLSPGGSDQWDFPVGGRVQVQFLEFSEAVVPVFRIKSRAAEVDLALDAGEAMRAVDDLGEQKRVYTAALHQLRRDRTGRAEAALISVVVTVE
jgi:hypothetical protein